MQNKAEKMSASEENQTAKEFRKVEKLREKLSYTGNSRHRIKQRDEITAKRQSLKPLMTLKPYILKYKGRLYGAIISLTVAAGAMLVLPLGVRRMIDQGFSSESINFIHQYFMVIIFIGLVLAVASAMRFYFVTWIGERVVADLRSDVFAHVNRLSPAFFESIQSGEIMSRLTADTTQINAALGSAVSQALRNLVMLIGGVIMMVLTSPKLSALVLIAIPLIVLPLVGYGRVVRKLSRHAQDELAVASAYASEMLLAIRTLQAYTHERAVQTKFSDAVEVAFEAARHRMWARSGLTAMAIFLVFASIVGIMWYGAQEVYSGTMTGGTLGQFVLYAVLAGGSLGTLSEVWGEIQQAAGSTERLSELLSIKPEIESPANPMPFPHVTRGDIEFKNVHFTYPTRPEQQALNNVSFSVKPGTTLAIVGSSGAGKSTIFGLLLRFYDVESGEILIDGVPVEKADLAQLRSHIALVAQETDLFADTVFENIRFGAGDATEKDVETAAMAAQAHEFILQLPDGYQTNLGEKGIKLSGGQRQRIAIARAILRDAPILLLDEATSALDSESENLVQSALDHVMKGRTTVVIAHRLATVQKADKILVLDEGRIVETGNHLSLIKNGGVYARLANLQFASTAAE